MVSDMGPAETATIGSRAFDPDFASDLRAATLAPAQTPLALPYRAFRDEQLLDVEVSELFARDWILACREQEIPKPGDYRAITIGGEPVLVVRGHDGALRAMSNVCRHRGTMIVEGYGTAQRLECPYHAWTYSLSGQLLGTPYHGNIAIDRERHCLPAYQVDTWGGLVFVCMAADAEPLGDRLQGLDKFTERYVPSRYVPLFRRRGRDFEVAANWKQVFENAMESYHLFKVHPKTLNDVVPTKGFVPVGGSHKWGASEGGKALWTEPTGYDPPSIGQHERTHRVVVMIPPSMVALYDHLFLSYIVVDPVAVDRTVIRATMFVPRELADSDWTDMMTRAEGFTTEDVEIVGKVFAGNRSRSRHLGQLVEMERIVGHFHNYLGLRFFGEPTPASAASDA
jgi:phenylpropionate dioxygenase-like ring-hydroxylating dioxygenase large terminal subunit